MTQQLLRSVSVVLLPCLLADPTLAAISIQTLTVTTVSRPSDYQAPFKEQALTLVLAGGPFLQSMVPRHQDPFIQTSRILLHDARKLGSRRRGDKDMKEPLLRVEAPLPERRLKSPAELGSTLIQIVLRLLYRQQRRLTLKEAYRELIQDQIEATELAIEGQLRNLEKEGLVDSQMAEPHQWPRRGGHPPKAYGLTSKGKTYYEDNEKSFWAKAKTTEDTTRPDQNERTPGADTGGDLQLMSRMLRFLDKFSAHTFGTQNPGLPRLRRIDELARKFSRVNTADEVALIKSVRLEAEGLLHKAGLPRPPRKWVQILLIDLPNSRHTERFINRFVKPDGGVRALHYELDATDQVIVMRRDDFNAERLAHELAEIALMLDDPQMHWTRAHNLVNASGLGRGHIHMLHLPVLSDIDASEELISDVTNPLFTTTYSRLFAGYGIDATPELIADIRQGFDTFYERGTEMGGVLDVIVDENSDGGESAYERLAKTIDEMKHLPSAAEMSEEIFSPILARHGISPVLTDKILQELNELDTAHTNIKGMLLIGQGAPLDSLISTLIDTNLLQEQEAVDLAAHFALRLGWTQDQVTEALQSFSLASSQNEFGADVSVGPHTPRASWIGVLFAVSVVFSSMVNLDPAWHRAALMTTAAFAMWTIAPWFQRPSTTPARLMHFLTAA